VNFRQKLLIFLYSTPHIVGSVLAIIGLLLFFTGIIKSFWYAITIGLYFTGLLIVPRSETEIEKLTNEANVEEIRRSLKQLLVLVRKHTTAVIINRVESIIDSIEQVLPRLEEIKSFDNTNYVVREMAMTYLPETLQNYLKLPAAYARFHTLRDGTTAREKLVEQLAILDEEMKAIVENVNLEKVNELESHGKFLRSRFGKSVYFTE